MLIITDVETLYRIPDNELKKLTAKDRVIIFSRNGAQMPMSKFQALASVKAKMEIIESPVEIDAMSESDRLVYTGYLYGSYAATAKAQEPVKIYSALFDKIAKAGTKASGILRSMGRIQICGVEEKKGGRKAPSTKKSTVPSPVPAPAAAKKTTKPAKPAAEKKVSVTVRKTEKKVSPLIEKMCSMGLADMKAKLSKNEEHIIKALRDATDAEIGYKFQLKMYFGEADSVKIWDKTSKAFEQLKKLI
ncbi:MAG: hypothetical protein J6X66_13725 [Lachnospiraceae bacterium]|nr:hypothetical protein [Lachnospiraceae bacterium]